MPTLTEIFELDVDLDTVLIFAIRSIVVFGIAILYVGVASAFLIKTLLLI